jgi:hypothetical protein
MQKRGSRASAFPFTFKKAAKQGQIKIPTSGPRQARIAVRHLRGSSARASATMVAMAYKEPGEQRPVVLMQYSLPPGVDARQPYMLALKPKHSTWYKTESQNARNRPRNLALNPGMPPLDREDAAKALELLLTFESSYVFLLSCGQSNCRAWYDLRPGFVTSTGASDLASLSSTMRPEYTDLLLPTPRYSFGYLGCVSKMATQQLHLMIMRTVRVSARRG